MTVQEARVRLEAAGMDPLDIKIMHCSGEHWGPGQEKPTHYESWSIVGRRRKGVETETAEQLDQAVARLVTAQGERGGSHL